MKSLLIFLTGCINPKGMKYTALNNTEIRKRQYIETIKWYYENTELPILFVENSNTDISQELKIFTQSGRLEYIYFDGNNFDKALGKGYGEAEIIEYGISNSNKLEYFGENISIIKITGRYKCVNINRIITHYNRRNTIYANLGNDDWGGDIADSRFLIAPLLFWKNYFLPKRSMLNDSKCYHFEHLLRNAIQQWKREGNRHREFWICPCIEAVSGTSGTAFKTKADWRYYIMYIFRRFFHYYGYMNPFYRGEKKKPIEIK